MTTAPVDLDHFRSMTDGDKEFEAEMVKLFNETVTQCLERMQSNIENNMEFEAAAHELKGACLNLGANDLAALCKKGQDIAHSATTAEKNDLLHHISRACEAVKQYLAEEF